MTNLAVLRARKGKKVIVPFQLASYSAMTEIYAPLLMMVLCLQFVSMTEPADLAPLNNAADGLTSELKESISKMMTEMMGSMKQQMLREFEEYFAPEAPELDTGDNFIVESDAEDTSPPVLAAIDNYINIADSAPQTSAFTDLAAEFPTSDKTGPAVDEKLASIVNDLCTDHLPKTKLDEVLEKYARPDNCTLLVAPKINKIVWQQLKQPVRTADGLRQKAQKLLLSAVCAILKACETVTGDVRTTLTHALVLAMSSNREINLRRRDALRPHLNSQYSALCNPSTPITTELFGDDITKEIDQLAKSNRLGNQLAGPRKGRDSRFHPYGTQTTRSN